MVRSTALLAAAALLMGCETLAPVVKTEAQTITVPVPVKCIDRADLPKRPGFPLDLVDVSKEKEALARLVNAARLEVKVRNEYLDKMDKVLDKCAKD